MKKFKKAFSFFTALVLVIAMIAGCTPSQQGQGGQGTAQPGDTTQPAAERRDHIVLAQTSDVGTFNPFLTGTMTETRVLYNIYDALIRAHVVTGEMVPYIAESFTVSDDGLVFTFNIRQGVTFHNGDSLDAHDIYENYLLWRVSANHVNLIEDLDTVTVLDDYTIEFRLSQPNALFLLFLSDAGIIHARVFNEDPVAFAAMPVGTGPYRVVAHHVGTRIELERHEGYFLPVPISTAEIRIVPDANVLAVALEMGEIDFSDNIAMASVSVLEGVDRLTMHSLEGIQINFVTFNVEKPPFDDVRVRQAVAYALNRQTIVDIAREGLAFPTEIAFLPGMPFEPQNHRTYGYNPQRARELLAEAGFPDGITIDEPFITFQTLARDAEVIQNQLSEVGINASIEIMEINTFFSRYGTGDFQIAVSGWNSFHSHPDFYMRLYRSDNIGAANGARFNNPVFDDLATQAIRTMDSAEAARLYDELYTLIMEEMPIAPFLITGFVMAYDNDLVVENPNSKVNRIMHMSWR
ncbi:MAG: ABC transporter substrate-binding protein [Defluviitaleaceae bacterium]|nr:ABC transporter substrate-binding protein [Defluviitaleaceae bacterium]